MSEQVYTHSLYYSTVTHFLSNNYNYADWSVQAMGSPPLSLLTNYKIVIWFTGDDMSTTLNITDVSNLQSFLNNGGNLFITGQDIGWDIANSSPSFYTNYLHAIYILDDSNDTTLSGSRLY